MFFWHDWIILGFSNSFRESLRMNSCFPCIYQYHTGKLESQTLLKVWFTWTWENAENWWVHVDCLWNWSLQKKLLFKTQIGEETLHMMHYVGRKSDLHFLTAACINAVKCILPWSRHASSEHAMHQRCFHRAGNSTESEAEVYCTHSSE